MNWVLKSAFVVAIVGSLAAPLCRAQNPTVGVVLDAESAHVSNGLLTSGTSLYSADVVKTESQGHVQLRISQTRLQMAGQSEAAFFPGASGAVTELRQGTMVFALNTAAESFEVFVSDVRIIPKNERPMLAEVTMKAPCDFQIRVITIAGISTVHAGRLRNRAGNLASREKDASRKWLSLPLSAWVRSWFFGRPWKVPTDLS